MGLKKVEAGTNIPDIINVIVEIPAHSSAVKYEVEKETGTLFVDRFMSTAMVYPCDYGYIPKTLSEDGDPVDVLVICPYALISGSVVECRPIGMMKMQDEKGTDAKLIAVPTDRLTPHYKLIKEPSDISKDLIMKIQHFFEHYKDLEEGKWVKVSGWFGSVEAKNEIQESVKRYSQSV